MALGVVLNNETLEYVHNSLEVATYIDGLLKKRIACLPSLADTLSTRVGTSCYSCTKHWLDCSWSIVCNSDRHIS